MSRATEDLLDALHGMQAQTLLDELQGFQRGKYLDHEGNPLPVPAALLGQINKFLKDNGVDRAIRPGDAADLLAGTLPSDEELAEDDDKVAYFRR